MSITLNQAWVDQFNANLHYMAEQSSSYLSGAVRSEMIKGKKEWFDRIGGSTAVLRTGDFEPKSINQPLHTRRMLTTNIWDINHGVQKEDLEKVLIDPQSAYIKRIISELNRVKDQTIIDAFDATVTVGQEGGSTLTFANDGGTTISAGGTSLNKAKLDTVINNWLENEIEPEDERYIIVSPKGLTEGLMKEEEFINKDYIMSGLNQAAGGSMGKIGFPYNLNVIVSTKLDISSTTRNCVAFTKSSMVLGYLFDIKTEVNPRYDLKGNPWQIDGELGVGGLRMEGERIQIVQITESA